MDGHSRRNLKMALILFLACHFMLGCAQQLDTPDQTTEEPEIGIKDQPYEGVYSALDGSWAGEFIIYEHHAGQDYQTNIPDKLDRRFLDALNLKETNRIDVQQTYRSKSPFYQTVEIVDTYQENGQTRSIRSTGVNKVQDGQLWCVVKKPHEKIVHQGDSPAKDVIIWQGYSADPLRKEYFYETVHSDTYEIVGYGYYGEDDPLKNPKFWFYGKYRRVR